MRRAGAILAVAGVLCGCKWLGARRDGDIIQPDREFAPAGRARPAAARPPVRQATGPSATTARAGPATTTSLSRSYRVIGQPEVVETAVLQVDRGFITVQQVLQPLRGALQALAATCKGDEVAFRAEALTAIQREMARQVEQTLVLAEAEGRLTEDEKKAIDADIADAYRLAVARAGGSRTAFQQQLQAQGQDLESWRRGLRKALMIQAYIHQRLSSAIDVNRTMMWRHYKANAEAYRREDRVQMQIVAVPFDGFLPAGGAASEEERRQARAKAGEHIRQAAAEIARGVDFAAVARKYSRGPKAPAGGVWPEMPRGSFRAAQVEQAALAQRPRQVSGIISTDQALYIVKTLARQMGGQIPFEEVQTRIGVELRRAEFDRLSREYLAGLRAKATVTGLEAFEKAALHLAVRTHCRP